MEFNDEAFFDMVNRNNANKNNEYANYAADLTNSKNGKNKPTTGTKGKTKNLKVYKSMFNTTRIVAGTVAFAAIVGGLLIPGLINADAKEVDNLPNADYYNDYSDITKYDGIPGHVSRGTIEYETSKFLEELEHENSFTR